MQRFIRKNQNPVFDKQQCPFCRSFVCDRKAAVCMLCNARQCHGNGLGNGQCSVCFHGLLPGWSGSSGTCSYKGCGKQAVARGRGRKYVCADHATHQGIGGQHLDGWQLIEEYA